MKLLLLLPIILAVVLAPCAARAQLALPLAVTNAIPALGTNTANVEIAVGAGDDVALQFSYSLLSAVGVNSNITAVVQQSVDGTNWVNLVTLAQTSSGATAVSYVTNLTVRAIPRLRIGDIVNANTVAVQNLTFWRSIKRAR